MIIDVTYDPSVRAAPVGFTAAIQYAVNFLEATITNPVTLNIDVGWGEIDGQTVNSSYLGESLESVAPAYSYAQVRSALVAGATSATAMAAVATLPTNDPTGGGNFDLGTADAKALGLLPANGTAIDGWVGFYSGPGTFTFNPNDRAVSGEYDFVGIALHEITEVMGRDADLGDGPYPNSYTALDLFRYAAPGVRDLTAGGRHSTAYFSIDGGNTNLDNFNTDPSGDYGDWASSVGNDSFLAFSDSGVENAFTSTDLAVMDAIGWNASDLNANDTTVLYQDVLFRAPDTEGLYAWAALLATDQTTLPQLVSAFVSSPEAQNVVDPIVRLYDGLFSRAPDVGGIQNWVSVEDAGTSLNTIVTYFVTSAEFAADYGTINLGNETQFISSLYQHFLDRASDPGGLAAWLGVLGSTPTVASEAAVVLAFVNCTEFLDDLGNSVATWLANAANSALAGTTATVLGTPTYATTITSTGGSQASLSADASAPVSASSGNPAISDGATTNPMGAMISQASGGTANTYVFNQARSGDDTIANFNVSTDQLQIAPNLNGDGIITVSDMLANATVSDGATILHLGSHEEITLLGIATPSSLAHAIVIS